MEHFLVKGQTALRRGYTTGTCATIATYAAVYWLLSHETLDWVHWKTPKGIALDIAPTYVFKTEQEAICAVTKDSGDDPDVTNGIRIFATVRPQESGITIDGGTGVGRVTKVGLATEIGEAAINPGPRRQILQAAKMVCKQLEYEGGLHIVISAEHGAEIAQKTFNERLGIVGGISILGTSGIVEPMSEQALIDTIHLEMDSKWSNGERTLLFCPGNYGKDFAKETLGIDLDQAVTISNYIGESIDYAIYKGFTSILLVGHAGKLLKLAAGVMQTHSSYADGRQEILTAHAAKCGISPQTASALMQTITIDEAIPILQNEHILHPVLCSVATKIEEHLAKRTHKKIQIDFLLFTHTYGEICRSQGVEPLLEYFRRNHA